MKHLLKLIILAVMVAIIATACGNTEVGSSLQHEHGSHTLPNGDLQELTVGRKTLPSFLDKQKEEIRMIYQLAADHADLLAWMPCYCGCADSAGHKSNMNCFMAEIKEDGSVLWDDHGTRCGVCLEIAVESARLSKNGVSAKEIRMMIDDKYKEGYAKPTPTPMPL